MKKKVFALALALVLSLSLAACGSKGASSAGNGSAAAKSAAASGSASSAGTTVTLRVAASPTPHAQILAQVKDVLAKEGINLVVTEYDDYVVPNTAVEEGDEDVNYFQHQPYLDQFNKENGTHLVSVAKIHYEPMGIYPGKCKSLDQLSDGATIAVPNDVTNEARSLQLLAAQGLITLKDGAGLNATTNDIVKNPKNLKFKELEAAMIPNTVSEVDLSVINSNYALQAGLNPSTDALASEAADSEAAQTYANILVVKEGHENDPAVQALVKALQSDAVRDYINNTFKGAVVPVF